MSTGVSSIYYLENQPAPKYVLEENNSYYKVKLHKTQAFFEPDWQAFLPANPLVQPAYVTFSSSVQSTFQPDFSSDSLHNVYTIQKGKDCYLGISTDLTDWLPARTSDSLHISVNYTVSKDKPIWNLITELEKANLFTKFFKPDVAAAFKGSQVIGKLISYLAGEGTKDNIFSLKTDFTIKDLKAGYYIAFGSHTDEPWPAPKFLEINTYGDLKDTTTEHAISRLSYVVLEVLGMPRLGQEMFRDQPWYKLLTNIKEDMLGSDIDTDEQRQLLRGKWRFGVNHIKRLAETSRNNWDKQVREIIAAAQVEVDNKLEDPLTRQAFGIDEELPRDLQEILGVETERELKNVVRDYQDALNLSKELLKSYNL